MSQASTTVQLQSFKGPRAEAQTMAVPGSTRRTASQRRSGPKGIQGEALLGDAPVLAQLFECSNRTGHLGLTKITDLTHNDLVRTTSCCLKPGTRADARGEAGCPRVGSCGLCQGCPTLHSREPPQPHGGTAMEQHTGLYR
ncbi:hypothetical protein Y1Q_0017693 [Alligator mississippiensis]|uniref:Uncharacterized protein n=1 Tax=Alligator mississippiensis TaxID=8496 RepID=A0A151LYB2_ALLMI|nr:hypothetical protein Y1Q_0017693 [Alligator mississippiensis]